MLVIKEVPPGTPPGDGIQITKNVDFATYAKTLAESRKAKPGDPKTTVLRIMRPHDPPEFSTDARGFLVALIHDLQLDVPAPENQAKGGFVGAPAKVYRIKVPLAEFALSYKVDAAKPDALRVQAKVEEFNPGTDSQVLAIADDETKGVALSKFSTAFVLGALGGQLRHAINRCSARSTCSFRGSTFARFRRWIPAVGSAFPWTATRTSLWRRSSRSRISSRRLPPGRAHTASNIPAAAEPAAVGQR